jgi:hypothetical protein
MVKPIKLSKADIARFWEKVDKRGRNDCWEWLGCKNREGYGAFETYINGKGKYNVAHRIACQLCYGYAGQMTCHSCNNPSCCNPRHLYPGTGRSNAKDRKIYGHWQPIKGEAHCFASLTEKQVLKIISLHKQIIAGKPLGATRIGRILSISSFTVNHILQGEAWSWLTGIKKKT